MTKNHLQRFNFVKHIFLAIVLTACSQLFAQQGGEASFDFVNVPISAHSTALGGKVFTVKSNDLSFTYKNPAFADSTSVNKVVATFGSMFMSQTGIANGYAAYGTAIKGRPLVFSAVILNYGDFERTNEYGDQTGTFSASDILLSVASSQPLSPKWTVGASLKPVFSSIAGYSSKAIFADLSLTYQDTAKDFNFALIVANAGFVYDKYVKDASMKIPFHIDLGLTKKFKHAPFRVSLSFNDIQNFNLRYDEPDDNEFSALQFGDNNSEISNFDKITDELLRHISISAEAVFSKNFFIATGYDFRAGKEMAIDSRFGGVGFSWGFGLRVSRYRLTYGNKTYHLAGGTNFFTLNIDLNNFKNKKRIKDVPNNS